MITYADVRISPQEALRSTCPTCNQPAGEWCIYVLKAISYNPGADGSRAQIERAARLGTRTKQLHGARTSHARSLKLSRLRKVREPQVTPASRTVYQIRTAMLEYDRAEINSLLEWLKQHGSILWEQP
jgi:hypothetical protein